MGRGNENLIAKPGHMTKMAATPLYGKNRWNKQLEPSQVSYRTLGPLVSTFSLMFSIYRHECSVFFKKYGIYKQPQAFIALYK